MVVHTTKSYFRSSQEDSFLETLTHLDQFWYVTQLIS